MTRKEQALKFIAKQIKDLDDNVLLLEETGMRFHTQKIRLELWDIITTNGYTLEQTTYKLIKNK